MDGAPPPPPPLPLSPVTAAKKKIPKWVWFLTIGGLTFIVALYGALFAGYMWIMDKAKVEIAKENPDFEMLYISNGGKIKVRHRPTGKEFLLDAGAMKKQIPIRLLATKAKADQPEWLRLPGAERDAKGNWQMALEVGPMRAKLVEALDDHRYRTESFEDESVVACDSKTLQCVKITYGEGPQGGQSWYSLLVSGAP